mmetsp:Transcript_121410/g.278212  ORF Transcript_121410/g.278212 Transcript_121410/m.278212 type:complete len:343 (-) Transcript_121410:83-1111(-)
MASPRLAAALAALALYAAGRKQLSAKPRGGAANASVIAGNEAAQGKKKNPVQKCLDAALVAALLAISPVGDAAAVVPWLPWAAMATKFERKPMTLATVTQGLGMAFIWGMWHVAILKLLTAGKLQAKWCSFLPFLTFITILGRKDPSKHSALGRFVVRNFWDPPLVLCGRIWHSLGLRFLDDGNGQFLTIIPDQLAMASMPFPSDVTSPVWQEAGITAVVNMTIEFPGPEEAYRRAGVEHLVLPTLDTSEPRGEDLVRGVRWMNDRLRERPGTRVLVHCKGGRGRAATIALAFQMANAPEGVDKCDPAAIAKAMQEKRSVVEVKVAEYPCIQEFQRLWKMEA